MLPIASVELALASSAGYASTLLTGWQGLGKLTRHLHQSIPGALALPETMEGGSVGVDPKIDRRSCA